LKNSPASWKESNRFGKKATRHSFGKLKSETEQVSVPVELKREEAVVERVSPSETRSTGKQPFQEERIEVPLKREEPVVEKESRVTGGVRIRKTEGVEQQTVQENVRREAVDIDESGAVKVEITKKVANSSPALSDFLMPEIDS
jgi:uncharacterized protein (TIGR02271 family)